MKVAQRFNDFSPYEPIEPFEILSARLNRDPASITKLNANENPYGPSPIAMQAIAEMRFPHIYPDPESRELRAALSGYTGVPADLLMAGSGADELIDLLLRVMLEPGDTTIYCPPTFSMYNFDTRLNNGNPIEIPRCEDFSLDVKAIEKSVIQHKPKVLFLTVPNNPDGGLPDTETINQLLELPTLVVIDEAYIEFSNDEGHLGEAQSRIQNVPKRDNLVVLRTFSKWAGLAGLRVGYGAFPEWLMPTLWNVKQPYNVNVAATKAALTSLQDLGFLTKNICLIKNERKRLFDLLSSIPFLKPFPSQANFILCKVNHCSAYDLKEYLENEGILVRYYNTPLLKDYIRISVGRPYETNNLIKVLDSFPEMRKPHEK
jgi:histidinol-phosphate aminotransferase